MASIKDKIKAGAAVIDVRTPDEFMDEHYEGARNIPVAVLEARAQEIGPKEKAVILYCASGARSAMGARILKNLGFTDVTNAGGLDDMPR